jgi:hypothetical protein
VAAPIFQAFAKNRNERSGKRPAYRACWKLGRIIE